MEHLGRHFERGEGVDVDGGWAEDEGLTAWAVSEGLVTDSGTRGKWLVGMEPTDLGGSVQRQSRRGRPAVVREDDGEDEDEE